MASNAAIRIGRHLLAACDHVFVISSLMPNRITYATQGDPGRRGPFFPVADSRTDTSGRHGNVFACKWREQKHAHHNRIAGKKKIAQTSKSPPPHSHPNSIKHNFIEILRPVFGTFAVRSLSECQWLVYFVWHLLQFDYDRQFIRQFPHFSSPNASPNIVPEILSFFVGPGAALTANGIHYFAMKISQCRFGGPKSLSHRHRNAFAAQFILMNIYEERQNTHTHKLLSLRIFIRPSFFSPFLGRRFRSALCAHKRNDKTERRTERWEMGIRESEERWNSWVEFIELKWFSNAF